MSELETPSELERQLLAERARVLARPLVNAGVAVVDTLSFVLSRERFAIAAKNVFAVFRLAMLVRLPGAAAPVVGVTRWRGDVLTLLDVRSLVGTPTNALDDLAVVLVVGVDQPEFGVLADAMDSAIMLGDDALLPPTTRSSDAQIIRGITRDGHLVIDAPALVARQLGARPSSSFTSS